MRRSACIARWLTLPTRSSPRSTTCGIDSIPRLAGMCDDEYFWEPVAGCWSLRLRDGRWQLDGGGGGGPAPRPVPVTTIAWRLGHLGGVAVGGFARRRFGDGDFPAGTVDFPSSVGSVGTFLAELTSHGAQASPGLTRPAGTRRWGHRGGLLPRPIPSIWPCTCSTRWSITEPRSESSETSGAPGSDETPTTNDRSVLIAQRPDDAVRRAERRLGDGGDVTSPRPTRRAVGSPERRPPSALRAGRSLMGTANAR
jgi:hypothetical protein